jgi:hypothetical protein
MADNNRIIVTDDNNPQRKMSADVANLGAIPDATMEIARYFGGGSFTATFPTGEQVFKLSYEWVEDENFYENEAQVEIVR